MTYVSTGARRRTRLATQLLITAIALAATILFSYVLQHSDASASTSRSGYETTTPR
ncbi:hypothetical protein [Nocardia vermiculata]|uniref:Uncharacterized protein n=1 Tax=Nocardia vermiculata TaxID=257274 RepID=A0A846XZU9_9NOCA|nr:hypothetical protein [Nocardia vermiculata]NKY50568.1 hypothetical protein [Nocardia vermiculata]